MDSDRVHALTPDEAKQRLRDAAQQVNLSQWVGRHRWQVMVAALVGGFIVGRVGIRALAQGMLVSRFAPSLLTLMMPGLPARTSQPRQGIRGGGTNKTHS